MRAPERTLSVGSSGADVHALHARLLDLDAAIANDELVEGFYGSTTRRAVSALQNRAGLLVTGVADDDTVAAFERAEGSHYGYVVGQVLDPEHNPLPRIQVRALDRDLRTSQLLGDAATGDDGCFRVRYVPQRSAPLDIGTADVYVQARHRDRVLYETPVEQTIFNAPALVSITVTLPARIAPDSSEFERLTRLIEPLMGRMSWTDLTETDEHRDITFLAGETGVDFDRITSLVLAYRMSTTIDIPPYFFYALFTEKVLTAAQRWVSLTPRLMLSVTDALEPLLYDIVLLPADAVDTAARRAIASFTVPGGLANELKAIRTALDRRADSARSWARDRRQRVIAAQINHLITSDVADQLNTIIATDPFGDLPSVLTKLRDLRLVPDTEAAANAAASLSLTEILGDDPQLIDAVRQRFGISGGQDAHNLAKRRPEEWAGVVEGPQASAAHSGAAMAERMAARYPTTAFAAKLAAEPNPSLPQAAAVAETLAAHPGFNLATGSLTALLASHSMPVDPATAAALRTAQRVYRLAPTYQQTKTLLDRGVTSAASVVRQGRKRFVRESVQSGAFSADQAAAVFRNAVDVHTASLVLAGQLYGAAAATQLPALAAASATINPVVRDFPNMKSLFNAIDMSECVDCRSVHGAAAYLADVLEFLGDRLVEDTSASPAVTVNGARDVLFGRRPDLAVTDLNCSNTNTSLPYLDVVCELLEDAVAPDTGLLYTGSVAPGPISTGLLTFLRTAGLAVSEDASVYGALGPSPSPTGYVVRGSGIVIGLTADGPNWRARVLKQTFGTDDQLAAAPGYVNTQAYDKLATTPWCFTLPFDLAHQETRRYFAQFDIDRAELMRRLQSGGAPSDAACAAEALGLSDAQRRLIVTMDPVAQPKIWNTSSAPAATTLSNVATFITRSGISYEDLLKVLELSWIRSGTDLFVQHLDSGANLAQKRIVNLDDDGLDRIHRFLRLRTATGWASTTLNRVICSTAGGNGALDDGCLIAIAAITAAAAKLSLTVDATMDLLETLDIDDPAGTYAATFLDRVTVGAVDARFLPAAVHANEAAEAVTPGSGVTLAATASSLAVALGISASDTDLILTAVGATAAVSAASLSAAYGLSRLARATGLTVAGLTDLMAVTATNPRSSAGALAAFADAADTMRVNPLPISTWRYLLRHEATDLSALEIPATAVTRLLTALHAAYQTAQAATSIPISSSATVPENASAVQPFLAKLPGFSVDTLAQLQSLLTDTWSSTTITESAFVDTVFVDADSKPFFDTAAIKAALAARQATHSEADQYAVIAAVADAVGAYLYAFERRAALKTAVATAFSVDEDLAWALLSGGVLKEPPAAGQPLLRDVLLDDSNAPATTELQEHAVALLHNMTIVVTKLALPMPTVEWLLANAPALGWLELDHLPYASGQPASSYSEWNRLTQFLGFAAAYPDVTNPSDAANPFSAIGFFDAVRTGSLTDALDYLAALTGTDVATLAALDAHLGLSVPDLSGYRDPATATGLLALHALLRILGLDVPTAIQVSKPVLDLHDAMAMRTALKSRYAPDQWLGVLKQIQDPLRELKRDALVAYLLAANPDLASADDLYDYFLIDTQMTAGMTTSRIVQAHATVQLFVMRCLMGLEPAAVASVGTDDGWTQWDWMANFRVWEANRKIFLWPENWISPELRDNKSELFVEFENTLQQNELTETTIADALDTYLEGLDDIAHLEVMAAYYDTAAKIQHVFARTRGGSPAAYYHREFHQERTWTPWEKVPLDIKGDQLLAFSRNSRLTIAWPECTKEPNDKEPAPVIPDPASLKNGGQPTKKPRYRWKIRLAVSEYADGHWREKRLSDTSLITDWIEAESLPDQDAFTMLVWQLGDNQAVACFQQLDTASSYVAGATPSLRCLGSFALTGCKGVPEAQSAQMPGWIYPLFMPTMLQAGRFDEVGPLGSELATATLPGQTPQTIFRRTPAGHYDVTYPLQMTVLDWIAMLLQLWAMSHTATPNSLAVGPRHTVAVPTGTLLPYYFGDYARDYVIIPGFYPRGPIDLTHGSHGQEKTPAEPAAAGGFDPEAALTLIAEDKFIQANKKTVSDVLTITTKALALVNKYLDMHKKNPGIPVTDLVKKLVGDPDYTAILAELTQYLKLRYGLQIANFYHPLVCSFRKVLNGSGIDSLMARTTQLVDTGFSFASTYQPGPEVITPYPRENVDFELDGAYASYNWELFFHVPFDVAMKLCADQQFDKAREWFHYIFNPVGIGDYPAPRRFWNTKPFFLTTADDYLNERIDTVMNTLAENPAAAGIGDLAFAVTQWRKHPFRPDVVARSRPVAYQMAIVMNYVQNLVDWGDNLFRQFTRESVNQATQLYVLADKLLGTKPRIVPPAVAVPDMNYQQLQPEIDMFSNAMLDLENLIPKISSLPHHGAELPPAPATLTSLYFCIPPNEKLLSLWDLVADRLFKIRNCQNIDGIAASLALFSPPIDPGALVRAAAAGMDISSFLAGLGAPLPNYRFTAMAPMVTELTQHVYSLGVELQSALEKRDSERLARLRQTHEISVLDAMRTVKLATIEEAKGALTALERSAEVIQARIDFYSSRQFMNAGETTAAALNATSLVVEASVALAHVLAGGLKLVPNFMAGAAGIGGTATVNATMGGQSMGGSAVSAAETLSSIARTADKSAGMASIQANYERRQDDWNLQLTLAEKELVANQQQIANINLHLEMLGKDLAAHDLQVKNAAALHKFMLTKFTGEELCTWTAAQISAVYYPAYKLAHDSAKMLERCYCYELARDDSFIRFGYWNSQKKGLTAADALLHDIRRMEKAYRDNNTRDFELTKHISLSQVDPFALLQLKTTGKATITIPEIAFDLDHPSHFKRRIKSVSVSLMCNAGPYTTVGMTLSLIANKYRRSTEAKPAPHEYTEDLGNDGRFAYNPGTIASIATSSAVSDSGLFELNFRDERYLPFEGAGAISTWSIELPNRYPQFDYDTISDLILHMRYTASEGGSAFRKRNEKAQQAMLAAVKMTGNHQGLCAAFSVRDTFVTEWWQLKETGATTITIDVGHLPYLVRGHSPELTAYTWAAKANGAPAKYSITVDGTKKDLNRDPTMASLCVGDAGSATLGTPVSIACDASQLDDLTIFVSYKIND